MLGLGLGLGSVWELGARWHWCVGWWGLVDGWVTRGPGGLRECVALLLGFGVGVGE